MEKIKHLIVGAGLSGAILAERITKELSEKVLIVDIKDHIAGNCYDYKDENGIHIHKYGPHIFHTSKKQVWDYLSKFTKWHIFFLKVKANIDNINATLPFNLNTIHQVFPRNFTDKIEKKLIDEIGYGEKISILDLKKKKDTDLNFLANFIYEKVFLNYFLKQWGERPEDIDPSVAARVPVYISRDDGYFRDKYQGIPNDGYTKMFEKILDNPLIEIKLNTSYRDIKEKYNVENLYYTGPIDEFFEYKFGELPYRSLTFDVVEEEKEYFQESVVVSYPNNYDFTRICEHKYFLDEKSKKTVVSYEYPTKFEIGKNERYYPIPKKENQELYNKYLTEAEKLKKTYFLGRLGDYKYYNMDLVVERALTFFDEKFKR